MFPLPNGTRVTRIGSLIPNDPRIGELGYIRQNNILPNGSRTYHVEWDRAKGQFEQLDASFVVVGEIDPGEPPTGDGLAARRPEMYPKPYRA